MNVVVVGGGLAGITAALRCADAGAAVTLVEAHARLGGLTHSFTRHGLAVDNGQHVFLRCCTAYRLLLERLDVAGLVTLQDRLDIGVRAPGRRPARLRRSGLSAPVHLAGALARYHLLTPAERLRAARAMAAMRRVDPADPATDAVSLATWLRRHGQRTRGVQALWDLLTVATLNAPAEAASLALAATVVQEGLLTDARAGDIGWSTVPLAQLHGGPALRVLSAAGVDVRTSTRVTALRHHRGGWAVRTAQAGVEADIEADAVVLATPAPVAERLAPPGAIDAPAGFSSRLGSVPIVNVHVVLDRPALDEPFVAGVDTPVQWVFDRTGSSGLATGGQYLAVSLSAAQAWIDRPTREIRAAMLPELRRLIPAVGAARVADFFVTRERHATFAPAPGTAALRPPVGTRAPGLVLAGAWTATGWPATMEGAVRSGRAAARAALRRDVGDHAESATTDRSYAPVPVADRVPAPVKVIAA